MTDKQRGRRRAATIRGMFVASLLGLAALAAPQAASAEVVWGTLSNFDVPNDTGEETHGFEIELDGVSSSDISYEFGAPYERYGNPIIENFPGGVYVRYESPYDPLKKEFTETTPLAASPITPTLGHQCWTGGSAEYWTSGCEHFGLGLVATPTKTAYHWLVADPSTPGNLIQSGSKVGVPPAEWSVQPPAGKEAAPVVQAEVQAPEPEGGQEFGEAQWVKVYVTESHEKAELDHLLTDDPAVPEEASQTEVEWKLIQTHTGGEGGVEEGEEHKEKEEEEQKEKEEKEKEKHEGGERGGVKGKKPLGEGNESVTRRYEFYAYTGPYDPETHEAIPVNEDNPAEGEVGEFVGAQMAALNLLGGEPAPSVAKVSPNKGAASGGTTVKITGSGFKEVAAVYFGSTQAASFTVAGGAITAVSPPGASGATDITVSTPNGTSATGKPDVFTYGKPTVTGISPTSGPKAGGTTVVVTGTGFAPGEGTTLTFGKVPSVAFCSSTTSCEVVTPAAKKAGSADVLAAVGKAKSKKSAADRFSYQ